MADPRFYENRGPFSLAAICAAAGIALPDTVDGGQIVTDLASLDGAGAGHLSFFTGGREMAEHFAHSRAAYCFVPAKGKKLSSPDGVTLLPVASVAHAFAATAALFYPQASQPLWTAQPGISPDASLAPGAVLGPGVVIGPGAEIGEGARIGPNSVIGPGVTIGRACEIGGNVSIAFSHLGDRVTILPGAQIGQPGFGFASSGAGHVKIPQLGRVIIQDNVEIGAATAIDRGALSDTVIGEGSKIDNLVQIAHNVHIGRHCIIAAQTGIAGSCVIGDFVVMGGQVGLGDHSHIGAGVRLGARSATVSGQTLEGGKDYGGVPAKPIREWAREIHAVNQLIRRRKQDEHD